ENSTLREQLLKFNSCECETGNGNELLPNALDSKVNKKNLIKIATKTKCSNKKITNANLKKNVAVLFAMAFMVSLNVGNFRSYLNKPFINEGNNVLDSSVKDSGRRLLWVETQEEYNKNRISNSRVLDETVVPPLYFLSSNNGKQNANSTEKKTSNLSKIIPECIGSCNSSKSITNQSEYIKLAQNLHKWTSGNLNMSSSFTIGKDNLHGFKLSNDYLELDPETHDKQGKRKIHLDLNDLTSHIQDNQRKLNKNITYNKREQINLISVIQRKDDTFYVLSFNMDHALLPALNYNNSARPKMSIILPLENPAINGNIKLMQVDCEVFNTKEFEVKPHMIPARLRPNTMKWKSNTQKFKRGDIPTQISSVHEKPRVRNFYMVGPKNQAAAAASNEKTRFIQFKQPTNKNNSQMSVPSLNARTHEFLPSYIKPKFKNE
uniref:Uncharacterized protein LOC108039235 n=1 Tax=Drosophila rhopaloa TaxID=1041015 RepID=A0A6P4E185_DRORH